MAALRASLASPSAVAPSWPPRAGRLDQGRGGADCLHATVGLGRQSARRWLTPAACAGLTSGLLRQERRRGRAARRAAPAATVEVDRAGCRYQDAAGLHVQYNIYPDPLGAGGFGSVHRAKHLKCGHMYAVKCLKKQPGLSDADPASIGSIRREVAVMTQLRHSLNIAHLHEVFEDEAQVFMVMELCEGGDIWSHRDIASGHFSESQAAEIVREILRSVAQCHAKDIAYRDVKPENFLFMTSEDDQQIRAVDFGLAAPCPPGTVLTQQCGSPFHVAPEVLAGEYGLPADVWSVGVVAYHLLCGEVPFKDPDSDIPYPYFAPESCGPMFEAIQRQQLEMSDGEWDGVSPEAKDFVRSLLKRDPRARPSAQEALRHPWVQGEAPSEPLGISVVQRLQRFGNYSRFKQEALLLMAQEVIQDDERLASLRSILATYDVEGDGSLRVNQLHVAMKEAGYMVTLDDVDFLVAQMDHQCVTDGSVLEGTACYIPIDEFVAALADLREVHSSSRWEQMARGAFAKLDYLGAGKLALNQLVEELCINKDDEDECIIDLTRELSSVARSPNQLDDCVIGFEEFKQIITRDDLSNDLELYATRAPRGARRPSAGGSDGETLRALLLQC